MNALEKVHFIYIEKEQIKIKMKSGIGDNHQQLPFMIH